VGVFSWIRGGALAAGVLAAAAGGCSSGGGGARGGGAGGGGGGGDGGQEPAIALTVTETRVESMAAQPGPFPEDVWSDVYAVLNAYLDRALVLPLRTGEPPSAIEELFMPAALERATTVDRAALVEDGGGRPGRVTSPRTHALLVLLTDRQGGPVVVNATVDLVLAVEPDGGPRSEVSRTGQLALVRTDGGWRIDSYDVRAARGPGS